VFLGVREAVRVGLGKENLSGVHIAIQGTGSVGGGLARHLVAAGARLTLADIDTARAARLAEELGGVAVPADAIMDVECDVFSPNALGAILDDDGIARLRAPVVAGGANNQLARAEHGDLLMERGVLYAPDYVINAGGIIAVTFEYLARRDGNALDLAQTEAAVDAIPGRLAQIWDEARSTGMAPSRVADTMAQRLIGRI
jgi:leucine dehydrogenase